MACAGAGAFGSSPDCRTAAKQLDHANCDGTVTAKSRPVVSA
ncbi:hypothetical protein L838_2864 [Mycobacterium avium MAV_120709_2344]|nr:hypothetical protein L839_4179 [Mycobacterium avium MAV_120809_2495]ETZ51432.1 hypothetical protein L838_2864 [Mycobacterium avium MAV_120709_2344]